MCHPARLQSATSPACAGGSGCPVAETQVVVGKDCRALVGKSVSYPAPVAKENRRLEEAAPPRPWVS